MTKFKKVSGIILKVLLVVFIVIQFIRPGRNTSGNTAADISHFLPVPSEVDQLLTTACNDCHSNTTVYPWYANVQPLAWWLNHHVEEGKQHLNFNEFMNYRIYRQFHKMEEVEEVLAENEMPLSSYTLIHRDAKLDEAQKKILIDWSRTVRDSMKARYPADSLINPRKRGK